MGDAQAPVWHILTTKQALRLEDADAEHGLTNAEVAARAERFSPNRFTELKSETRLHAFGLLLQALTVFNAVLGLRQEGKAAAVGLGHGEPSAAVMERHPGDPERPIPPPHRWSGSSSSDSSWAPARSESSTGRRTGTVADGHSAPRFGRRAAACVWVRHGCSARTITRP